VSLFILAKKAASQRKPMSPRYLKSRRTCHRDWERRIAAAVGRAPPPPEYPANISIKLSGVGAALLCGLQLNASWSACATGRALDAQGSRSSGWQLTTTTEEAVPADLFVGLTRALANDLPATLSPVARVLVLVPFSALRQSAPGAVISGLCQAIGG